MDKDMEAMVKYAKHYVTHEMPIDFRYREGSPMWNALLRASMEYGIAGQRFSQMRERFWKMVVEELNTNIPDDQKAKKIFLLSEGFRAMRGK